MLLQALFPIFPGILFKHGAMLQLNKAAFRTLVCKRLVMLGLKAYPGSG